MITCAGCFGSIFLIAAITVALYIIGNQIIKIVKAKNEKLPPPPASPVTPGV